MHTRTRLRLQTLPCVTALAAMLLTLAPAAALALTLPYREGAR
jgi:hypothetical protein